MTASKVFDRQLSDWGLGTDRKARRLLLAYTRMLSMYKKANVIGTRDFDEILRRHVLDSLSCMILSPVRAAERLADIGSGGGLPGVPLAVMMPNAEITLFESTAKKAAFLRYVIEEMNLGNVTVVNARVEEAAHEQVYRGAYDVCTVRALARLSVLAEYSLPLLRRGGHLVAMKGREDADERSEGERALAVLGGHVCDEVQVPQVPGAEQKDRRLLLLKKVEETPHQYPRRTGVPVKDPLGKKK